MSSNFHSFSPNLINDVTYLYVFEFVAGDSKVEFEIFVKKESCEDGEIPISDMGPFDLTDFASAIMKIRAIGGSEIIEEITQAVVSGDPTEGVLLMMSDDNFIDDEPGEYEGEIQITFTDGRVLTIKDLVKFIIKGEF